jgi:hypothetical protein
LRVKELKTGAEVTDPKTIASGLDRKHSSASRTEKDRKTMGGRCFMGMKDESEVPVFIDNF